MNKLTNQSNSTQDTEERLVALDRRAREIEGDSDSSLRVAVAIWEEFAALKAKAQQ